MKWLAWLTGVPGALIVVVAALLWRDVENLLWWACVLAIVGVYLPSMIVNEMHYQEGRLEKNAR